MPERVQRIALNYYLSDPRTTYCGMLMDQRASAIYMRVIRISIGSTVNAPQREIGGPFLDRHGSVHEVCVLKSLTRSSLIFTN